MAALLGVSLIWGSMRGEDVCFVYAYVPASELSFLHVERFEGLKCFNALNPA